MCFIPVHIFVVRLQLNKQIQQLEGFFHDDERQKSQFSASTTRTYQYETPQVAVHRIDPMRFDAQIHLYNEPGENEKWNSSSVSFSSVERFSVSSYPVEREPYIPKIIKVNYIEGSNDQKWRSCDFPWTKKLEVCIWIIVNFLSPLFVLIVVYLLQLLGQQQKGIWESLIPPQSERGH